MYTTLSNFIKDFVIHRRVSMFLNDINTAEYSTELSVNIKDKKILVIGGAGSIGSSFIRALLQFEPKSLVVVDTNENALAELTRDLRSTPGMYIPEEYIPYPMDFSSEVFKTMFFDRCKRYGNFDIVANFSAHKHVRSEKDIYSIEALLTNNIIHARKLLDLLKVYPPEHFFCVSTDKAANPVNIMGASKRIMEDLIFTYSEYFPVTTARFANVAFSNGSLPEGFLRRIDKLQPISAPSDIKRFFVSPEESGQICMLACILGQNREIFFPKLEEEQMETFDKIAVDLLHEKGFEIDRCSSDSEAIKKSVALQNGKPMLKDGKVLYPVYFSKSDTVGEKSFEEFFTATENVDMNRFKSLGVVTGKSKPNEEKLIRFLDDLEKLFENNRTGEKEGKLGKDEIVRLMAEYLPNFHHIETGKNLDSKM